MNTRETKERKSLQVKRKPMEWKSKRIIQEYEAKEKEREKQEVKIEKDRYDFYNK